MMKTILIILITIMLSACAAKNKTYDYKKSPCKPQYPKKYINFIAKQPNQFMTIKGKNVFIECDSQLEI